MEDKSFELLTKMYNEFSERFDNIEKEQRRQSAILENDIKSDTKVLYDGYKQTYEKLTIVDEKVDLISSKVEKQDVEIRVIKGAK
jgi:hypothetical protein